MAPSHYHLMAWSKSGVLWNCIFSLSLIFCTWLSCHYAATITTCFLVVSKIEWGIKQLSIRNLGIHAVYSTQTHWETTKTVSVGNSCYVFHSNQALRCNQKWSHDSITQYPVVILTVCSSLVALRVAVRVHTPCDGKVAWADGLRPTIRITAEHVELWWHLAV